MAGILDFIPVVGSVLGSIIDSNNQAKAREQNWDAMLHQEEWSEKMWNLQNEYNRPDNVMARYKDAGMNPALIASQVTGGYAQGAALPGRPQFTSSTNFGQAMAQGFALAQQNKQLDNQTKLTEAEVQYKKAAAATELVKAMKGKLDSRNMELMNDLFEQTFGVRVLEAQQRVDINNMTLKYLYTQNSALKKQMDLWDKSMSQIDNAIENNTKITEAQVNYLGKQGAAAMIQAGAAMKNAIANQLSAQAAWKNAETNALNAETEKIYKQKLGDFVQKQTERIAQDMQFNSETWNNRKRTIQANLYNAILSGNQQALQNEILEMSKMATVGQNWYNLGSSMGNASNSVQRSYMNVVQMNNMLLNGWIDFGASAPSMPASYW